jgi:NADPH-dependent 2,4-dienoyl-CoA reductase/sulfur reductase-like enzyme
MRERGSASFDVDVAVIGAGPAGIAASACAAEAGRRVALIDEGLRPGGQIWRHMTREKLPRAARSWLARLDRSGARILSGTSVIDIASGFTLRLEHGTTPRILSAGAVILATGARERFLPFPGWTLPGVIGAGGAQALVKSGADLRGKRAVIAGSGPLLLAVAGALARSGVHVQLVAEQAPSRRVYGFAASLLRTPARIAQAIVERAAFAGTPYLAGTWVTRAAGDETVREVTLTDGRRQWTEPCDLLCTGYGLVPANELARALGCTVLRGRVLIDAHQRTTTPGVLCAGEPTGIAGVDSAIVQGEIAGLIAAGRAEDAAARFRSRNGHRRFALRLESTFALREELRALPAPDTIVCRCEDVTHGRIHRAWSARETKLRTRAGMGPCQGRVCGGALEFLLGHRPDAVRPPFSPARAATLALAVGSEELRGDPL